MKLYHSSYMSVEKPDVFHSREYLDFGKGFHMTSLREQAVNYANRFLRRQREGWLNEYEFEFDSSDWKILEFDSYDKEWLNFVAKCRGGYDETNYDLIIGGIANDKVIRTLDRYFAGELSENQTLGILKYEKPNIQYCVRNQTMLEKCLKHVESKKI